VTRTISLPPLDGITFASTHLCTWVGERLCGVLPENKTQCPWPGLEHCLHDPETNQLTMRPPHLSQKCKMKLDLNSELFVH